MLSVHKIGGTSMSKFEDVLNNIIIGQAPEGDFYNRIFVVSAYNNVTNWLLEHKKTGEPGVYDLFAKNSKITGRHWKSCWRNSSGSIMILDRNRTGSLDVADAFITEQSRAVKELSNQPG